MTEPFHGYALMRGDDSFESAKISLHCNSKDIPCIRLGKKEPLPDSFVPSGSVEWCERLLGRTVTPEYYPEWMSKYLERKVWQTDKFPLGDYVFIKPADRHKRFNGFKTNGSYRGKKRAPYWCSEIVGFSNEWRYYIANGEVVSADWYLGDEVNTPEAPALPSDLQIPEGWCGTLDMGTSTRTGNLILVEAHPPYSCGWYGKDIDKYLLWLSEGWKYLKGERK